MSHFNQPGAGAPISTAYEKTVLNCRNLIEAEQYDAAVGLLLNTIKQSPRDVQVLRMLGHCLMMIDAPDDSIRHLTFASKLDPTNPDLLCDLASALRRVDELRKAHQAVDEALRIAPGFTRAIMVKARLLQSHGQPQRAYEIVRESLQSGFDPNLLGVFGQLCRELKHRREGIDTLKKGLDIPTLSRQNRQDILFALGHLLDAVGEYDRAFECFSTGNSMAGEASHTNFEHFLERWATEKYERVPFSDADGSRAVFIVGMPRSGTTLTEQIIASHPSAGGVGESQLLANITKHHELADFDHAYMNRSARTYLDMLAKSYPDASIKRVCDKMPENFYYMGMARKMLPGCRIIHCKRNPIDTCLSIYFQRFGPRLFYATDLEQCAEQYLVYLRAIEHLSRELGVEMHDAVYEETTSDPESAIRAMLGYVSLPFDPACMEFHKSKKSVHTASAAQIRQPIYTSSTQRWKNYEKHISPLIEKLGHLVDP